jgi:DNA polymerase III subunit epsilon
MRQIAFDTETTGLDLAQGHRIVEIGCVEMIDYIKTDNYFHIYLNPQRDIPIEAQKVHGLSIDFLKDKPLFKDVAADFLEFVGDSTLVAHNAGFDMKFINYELLQAGLKPFSNERSIDTLQIARRKYPGQSASLDALCRKFEVDLSARTLHGALLDAQLLADVYLELMGGRQVSLLEEKTKSVAEQSKQNIIKVQFPRRQFQAPQAELESHQAFMQKYILQK